jgi:SAM-dependent methyltransferase
MSVEKIVQAKYGDVAQAGLSSDHAGVRAVAEAFGYSADELASIPAEANMGLSCGNPTAFASLTPGETVVDLGCGGGLDVFLAAAKVGPSGKAIGIDMTPAMLELARRNAAKAGLANVEFYQSTIDKLPLPDASVDCIISNCVINLAIDKRAVFREMARVLKPGGRLAVSDIALKRPLPPEVGDDLMAYVGCVAGAISFDDYRQGLSEAGFRNVEIVDARSDLNAYANVEGQSACCSPAMSDAECCEPREGLTADGDCCEQPEDGSACCDKAPAVPLVACCSSDVHSGLADVLSRYNVNDFAASVRVFAVK